MAPPKDDRAYVMKMTGWQAYVLIALIDWARKPRWFFNVPMELEHELPELRERLVLYRAFIQEQEAKRGAEAPAGG